MIWSYILQKSKNMTIKKAQGHGQDFSKGVTLCQTEYSSKCHINPPCCVLLKKRLTKWRRGYWHPGPPLPHPWRYNTPLRLFSCFSFHLPAKAFSLPVITMAPTFLSVSKSSRASCNSDINWSQSAFNALGRLSWIKPTFCFSPLFSALIISNAFDANNKLRKVWSLFSRNNSLQMLLFGTCVHTPLNLWTPKIWLLILPSDCYRFTLVMRIWCWIKEGTSTW